MNGVRSIKNQYPGINAHLHSLWQSEGGWNNFHNRHIGDLAGLLRQKLLPMGYTAVMEESLQIRRVGDSPSQPRADILIGDHDPQRAAQPHSPSASALTVAELVEALEVEEKPYRAIAIYQHDTPHGEPVAWIELLSPTNKGKGQDAQTYLAKRRLLLESGLVFVEIDYLHETPPTFPRLADYSDPAARQSAHPYRIVSLDPRPDMKSGPAHPVEFDADQPIPAVEIPLTEGISLNFDFGAAYQKTFEEMAYGLELVDYAELPLNVDRYSVADQTRNVRRMLAVMEAAHSGADLEARQFPVTELSIDEALAQIAKLKKA